MFLPFPPALVLAAGPADTAERIDRDVKRCMGAAVTTMDMLECYQKGYERMDRRLNAVYQALMGRLGKPERALLADAQKKWLAFRDAELAAAAALDPSKDGSLGRINRNTAGYDMLKSRTLDLERYLQDAKESGE